MSFTSRRVLSFLLSRNQTSLVNLKLLRNGEKVDQVVYGKDYMLRADITHPDGRKWDRILFWFLSR